MTNSKKTPIVFGNASHVGMVRDENQDYYSFVRTSHGLLFVLADGMGGEAAGSLASRLAVNKFIEYVQTETDADPMDLLQNAMNYSKRALIEHMQKDPASKGMGTTLDALLIKDGQKQVYWIHIGDSRIYLYRNDTLTQVTKDQTLVQRMIDDGMINAEEAKVHPKRHVLSEVLGKDENIHPQTSDGPQPLMDNDTYLMCSDGLNDQVEDLEIQTLLRSEDPQTAAEKLIDLVNDRGGHDNTTIQIIRKGLPPKRLSRKTTIIEPSKPRESCLGRIFPERYQTVTVSLNKCLVIALAILLALVIGTSALYFTIFKEKKTKTPLLEPQQPVVLQEGKKTGPEVDIEKRKPPQDSDLNLEDTAENQNKRQNEPTAPDKGNNIKNGQEKSGQDSKKPDNHKPSIR